MNNMNDENKRSINEAKKKLDNIENIEQVHEFIFERLKEYFNLRQLQHEVNEQERFIDCRWTIDSENKIFKSYRYFTDINTDLLKSIVWISEGYDDNKSKEVLILAAHFNSLMANGIVRVDTETCTIVLEFNIRTLVPYLFSGEIDNQVMSHYHDSKNIIWAFNRLLLFHEDPVYIIIDLKNKLNQKNKKQKINK